MQRGTVAGVSLVGAVDESLRMVTLHQAIISQEVSLQYFTCIITQLFSL